MDQEDSWYTPTPGIVHQDKPAIFGTQDINPVASHTFTGSQDAGMYTRNELKGFWDSILINAASRTSLKKFSQNLIVYTTAEEGTDGSHYYTRNPSSLWVRLFRLGILNINFWTHLGLLFRYLSIAEFISRSFCSSNL